MLNPEPAPTSGPEAADETARLFDAHARAYAESVDESITASGEDVVYFARRKALEVRRWLRSAALPLPGSALDFGCGTGLSTAALSEVLGGGCTVTGVDLSPESLRVAADRHAATNVRFRIGMPDALPLANASLDLVFTACVFHHIGRPQHARWTREIHRVLRPGGVAFVFEHNPLNPLTVRAVRACPFDEGVELLRPGYTYQLLASAGFHVDRPHFYFFFPRVLRALRGLEPWLRSVPVGAQYFVAGRKVRGDHLP